LFRGSLISNLPSSSKILDLGCGAGFTSEIMAYCGGSVDSIDINPENVNLINARAKRLGLNIVARVGAFDDLHLDKKYDYIFFYECLHHAAKPWNLIDRLSKHIEEDGKIAFAGEPINSSWWPYWGLRLDLESLYMMRKYGWLESGWSEDFISKCFERAGLNLNLYPGVGLNRGMIGVATKKNIADRNILRPEIVGASVDGEAQLLRNELHNKEAALSECYGHLNRINSDPWWILGSKINKLRKSLMGK
jgi:SAM-dependent methyltransferase